jgi:hypothetical protein
MDYRTQMEPFRSQQWKAVKQIETHLITKYATGSGTGSILFGDPAITHMTHKIKILLHTVDY